MQEIWAESYGTYLIPACSIMVFQMRPRMATIVRLRKRRAKHWLPVTWFSGQEASLWAFLVTERMVPPHCIHIFRPSFASWLCLVYWECLQLRALIKHKCSTSPTKHFHLLLCHKSKWRVFALCITFGGETESEITAEYYKPCALFSLSSFLKFF